MNYLWPLLIVVFSSLLPGERLRGFHIAGALLGFVGVAALSWSADIAARPEHALGYALAFAAILLNTDLHNPRVRVKMSLPQFRASLRGIDAPPAAVEDLFRDIAATPIALDLDCDVVTFFAPAKVGLASYALAAIPYVHTHTPGVRRMVGC